jgi:predicted transcriptional regulator YheO
MYIIGKFSVKRDGDLTGEINENQFAGAMSFLTWEGNYEIRQAAQKVCFIICIFKHVLYIYICIHA